MPVKTKIMPMVKSVFTRAIFVLLGLIIINFIYLAGKIVYTASAQGVPNLISYQGRLYDTSGNLLGGAGTNYYFRFSIYDAASGGTKLWPAGTPSTMTYQVRYGVFNAQVGDTNAGGDALTLDFNDDTYFLQVEVASLANFSDGETLSPRQRITSAGYAKNADMVDGYHASTTPTANQVVALDGSGNLSFGTSNPVIQASNGLSLQTTIAGDINLTPNAGQVKIVSATTTQLTIGYDTNNRLDVKVSSAGAVTFDAVGSGAELIASDNFTVQGQIFVSGTATSTIAGDVNFDSGTLYIDSVNNRVGIGITLPAHTLSVNGTTNISGAVTLQSTLNVTGNTTLANASSTNLTVTNNSYFNTITATGQTVLANASTTNLTVSGDSYIGTVRSGTWNGSIIAPTYGGLGFDASSVQKGGIIAGTGAGTFGILAVGNNGLCLIASSTASNGVAWSDCATASGAITSLNGLTTAVQTFATSTSGGLDLFITSVGSTHTFTLQPASNYSIPLSASTTEWAGFYATPSTRISAGTGLSWSGNTLNASNAFTGSGTNGYVARWASSTGLTTGILLDNGTVAGVNATSSDYTFNIQGSSGVNPFNVASSTGDSLFNINQIGMVSIMGDVGIGTTTPYNPDGWNRVLDVSGGYHSKIITTVQDGNIQGGIYSHHLGYFGAPTGTMMGTYTDHPLSLITNSQARMIISNTGNVGIGTTTPAQTLVVAGSFRATGAFFDSSNASGTTGMLLQTTGTSTQWVTTSSLGIVSGVSSVTAGDGLGQDSTTGNLTLYIKPGTGITTSSDQISVDTNAQLTWTGTQTFANVSSTNLTVATDTYLNTLRTSGAIFASSTLGVSGAVTLHSTLNVQGQTTLVSVSSTNLTVSSNTYLANLNVSGAAILNSTLNVTGQTTLANASSSNFTVTNNSYFNTINASGQTTLVNVSSTNLTVSGSSYLNTLNTTGAVVFGSTLNVTGATTMSSASTTNLTVSGNSYLGTVMQGTWQGSVIAPTYGGLGLDASSVQKGGIIAGTGAGTFGILAVGNNGFCLTASSTATNGVAWSDCASSAITSLNGLTTAVQTFATSTSGGLQLNITSTGSVHTFALQPASGYIIPLSASTTEWSNFYDTPSVRITAGTGLSWSGNTLNAVNEFTGTGITNYVARWASSTGLTTGILVDTGIKVGIGTTSPSALLTVQATSTSDKTVLIRGLTGQTANLFELQNAGNSQLLTIDISGRTAFTISTTTNALVVNQLGTGNIAQFQASGTPIFTIGQSLVTSEVPLAINSVGDTGIAGNLIFTNPTASYIKSDSPLYIQAGDIANNESLYLSGSNAGLVIVDDNFLAESSSTSPIVRINQTGSGNILQLQGNGNDRLLVTAAGYVGIGSSTPTHTLAVQGIGGVIPFSVASSTGANLFTITQSGNVGIGTTTPAQTLTVVGSARVTGALYDSAASAGSVGMLLQTTGSGTQWVATSSLGIVSGGTPGGSSGQIQFNHGGAFAGDSGFTFNSSTDSVTIGGDLTVDTNTLFVNASTNRVGVGTSTPIARFSVQATAGEEALRISSSTGATLLVVDSGGNFNFDAGTLFVDVVNNRIGIGTTTPQTILDIVDPSGISTLRVKAGSSQGSNNLVEIQNVSGTNLAFVSSAGGIFTSSTLGVTGATLLHSTLNVQGQTILANTSSTNLTVSSNAYFNTVNATGQTTLANVSSTNLTVSSNAYLDTTTVASTLTGNGTTIFNDRVYFYSTIRDNSGSAGSYGNILMSTSTGVQWVATSSLGISGGSLSGGTNGYVARWTSASSLSSGKLLDDGTVAGVNATSSSYTFNIQGNSGVNPFNVASSTGNSLLTVLQTGRVGIGTSTPESELQVVGLIKSDILHIGGPTNTNQRFYVTSDNTGDNWPLAYIKESTSASTSTTRYAAYILNEGVGQQSASNYGLRVEATGASTASGVKNIAIIANGQNSYGSSGQNVGLQVSAAGHGVLGATSKAIEITGPTTHDDAWAIYSSATAKSYFAGALLASSTLSVTGATLLHSTLNVQGQTTLANASSTNLTVSSNAYFNTINATGQTTLANASSTNLTVSTNTYLNTLRTSGAILASSTLAVTGNADFYGANDFYGGVDFWGNTRLLSEVRDGNNSAGTYGMVLMTTSTGVQWVATSSLGISGGSLSGGTNGYVARWTSASSLSSGKLLDDGTVAGVNATSSSYTFNIQGNSGVSPFNIASSTGSSLLTVNQAGYVGVGTSTIPERLTIAGNTLILQEDKPTFIGNIGANLYSIFAMGDYVYGVGGGNQLEIYDVSKPSSIVQTAVDGSNLDNPVSLYVSGRYAYVLSLNNSTLQIFDISNPYSIVAKDYETSGLSSPTSIYVSGGYAYVTDLGNSTLQIYDISNPNNILVKDSITTGASSAPQDVYVVWPYAYVVDSVNTVLLIFDVSDPNNIVAKGSDSTSLASPNSIYVSGAYAYVTDDSNDILATYNISDPDTPTFLDNISTTNPVDAFVSGNYAYVVKSDGNSFSIYDVSDPANIISKNNYDVGVSYSVFVSGKYAYIGGDSYLTVLSLNNLTTPTLEAGAGYFGDLQVQDNALFNNDVMVSGGLNVGGDVSLQAGLKVISDAYINTVRVGLGSGNQAYNTALGREALNANTTGDYNTAVGRQALFLNTDGTGNTALGYSAGSYNGQSSGSYNTTIGMNTLYYNQTGNYNVYIGAEAGNNVGNAGSGNIVIGYDAGDNISSGNNNIVIGYSIDVPAPTVSNQMTIGNLLFGTNLDGTNTTISSGNIGIGTSTPIARLSVQAAAGQEALRISSSTGATLLAVETSGNFNFDLNTLYIDTINNRVGIGTSTPQSALDVVSATGISTLRVRAGASQGSNNLFEIQAANASSALIFTSTQQLRVYATSSGQYVTMYHDGTNGNINSTAGNLIINNKIVVDTIKTNGGTAQNYNSFGSGTPGQGAISSADDVYVTGDLEVDGTAYLTGGTAWTQGDFAEKMAILDEEVLPGDLIVANDLAGEIPGRLSYMGNSNQILGVISTAPAGILYSQKPGYPLALTGTVPVKVTTENGHIRRGDQITTSASVPGAGMKATTSTAGTVGIALEDYTASSTGYVTILLNINNKIDAVSQLAQVDTEQTSPTTTSSTDVVVLDNSTTTTIQVVNNNYTYNNTQIVVIDYEELGNIKVMGQAVFTGLVKVVDAEFSGRVLVKGDIIVAGDIDLSGAITTWFWQDIATSTLVTSSEQIQLGDAVAIMGENTVVPMWANTYEFKPAVGIAVALKPFASLSNEEIAAMPEGLKLKYEEILAEQVAQNTSTSGETVVISTADEVFSEFKMVKVAISGVVKGYENLIPGSRYYLALNEEISRQKAIVETGDNNLIDLINQTDALLSEANQLTSTSTTGTVAGQEEVIDNSLTKVSRTISYQEPAEQDAKLQVIGIAKSRSELLIQPSFNYSTYRDGYLSWEYGALSTATSTVTTTEVTNPPLNPIYYPIVNTVPIIPPSTTTTSTTTTTDTISTDTTSTSTEVIAELNGGQNEVLTSTTTEPVVIENSTTSTSSNDSSLLQPAGGGLQGSI